MTSRTHAKALDRPTFSSSRDWTKGFKAGFDGSDEPLPVPAVSARINERGKNFMRGYGAGKQARDES
jgi:hypothetical protein